MRENLLWKVFSITLVIILLSPLLTFFKINTIYSHIYYYIVLLLPVIMLFLHAVMTLSIMHGSFFFLLASFVGLIMEIMGLNFGTVFGGYYVYAANKFNLFHVPIPVIVYWAVFIYTGYCLTNSFVFWLDKNKPCIKKNSIFYLLFMILLDGFFVVAIDLFMDPLQVRKGSWIWLTKGQYFGVPIGNFFGWFFVAILTTGIFRNLEYYFPIKERKYNKSIFMIPVLGYGMMAISLLLDAIKLQMYNLAIIGVLLMVPTVLINIVLFIKRSTYQKLNRY